MATITMLESMNLYDTNFVEAFVFGLNGGVL